MPDTPFPQSFPQSRHRLSEWRSKCPSAISTSVDGILLRGDARLLGGMVTKTIRYYFLVLASYWQKAFTRAAQQFWLHHALK